MDFNSITGFPIINNSNLANLLIKFLVDLIVIIVIARFIYFRIRKNRGYLFTLCIFNIIIFLVCSMLSQLTLSLGFSFGIFAIFSILRYRTTSIPIKEMTYMFIAISIAIINALSNSNISIAELAFTNGAIIIITFVLEKAWMRNELMKYIVYEKIENVKPVNHELLLADLKERTGLNIHRFEIGKINFLRDIAQIRIYFYAHDNHNYVDEEDVDDDDD